MDYASIVTTVRTLALEAGAEIMEVYEGPDFEVKSKSDASPVTEADERADALIAKGLKAAFPEIPAVTEEQAASHGVKADVFFLVDPLDGTREYSEGRDDWAVHVALAIDGVPVFSPAGAVP